MSRQPPLVKKKYNEVNIDSHVVHATNQRELLFWLCLYHHQLKYIHVINKILALFSILFLVRSIPNGFSPAYFAHFPPSSHVLSSQYLLRLEVEVEGVSNVDNVDSLWAFFLTSMITSNCCMSKVRERTY